MDYLRDIKKMDQVYSNDLNEILLKTPPKIFRYALLTFLACIFLMGIIGYYFEYTEKKDFNFIFQKRDDISQIIIVSNEDISKYLNSTVVEVFDNNNVKQMTIKVSKFKKKSIWKMNGNEISDSQLNDKAFIDISKVSRAYKYRILIDNSSLIKELNAVKIGKIKIPTGEKKFYKLVF